jgi:hypothetical protein
LEDLPFWIPRHLVAFRGLLVAFTAAHNLNVSVSGYQPIDIHLIVLPVKFDGSLSISVLKNKQFLKKMERQKSTFSKSSEFFNFPIPTLEKRTDPHFFGAHFLVNGMANPISIFT